MKEKGRKEKNKKKGKKIKGKGKRKKKNKEREKEKKGLKKSKLMGENTIFLEQMPSSSSRRT